MDGVDVDGEIARGDSHFFSMVAGEAQDALEGLAGVGLEHQVHTVHALDARYGGGGGTEDTNVFKFGGGKPASQG